MEQSAFEVAADALHALLPDGIGEWHARAHRYGIKVWLGTATTPSKEHYEAQVIGAKDVPGATVLAIEIGWHAEHPRPDDNERALAALVQAERRWRKALGPEAVAGPFLGRRDDWRRLSETWPDPDLGDPDLAFDIASRLADYIAALEPVREPSFGDTARRGSKMS
jgi:hypothetical protein